MRQRDRKPVNIWLAAVFILFAILAYARIAQDDHRANMELEKEIEKHRQEVVRRQGGE